MSYDKMSLANIANGALEEKFQYELESIKKNMADENTDHKAKRSITVKITMLSNEERNFVGYETSIVSKFAPVKSSIGTLRLTNKNGKLELYQETSRDQDIFDNLDVQDPENKREINIKEAINK